MFQRAILRWIFTSADTQSKDLFEDNDFFCQNSVVSGPNGTKIEIEWLRPHELVSKPELYVDGTSRRDVIQGILGDCWLLSTCAALAKKVCILVAPLAWAPGNPSIFEQLVPEPINFGKKELRFTLFSIQKKHEIGIGSFGPWISIWEHINSNSQRSHCIHKEKLPQKGHSEAKLRRCCPFFTPYLSHFVNVVF